MLEADLLLRIGQAVIDNADVPSRSGALRGSLQARAVGEGRVEIVSNVPHAGAVHNGRKALTIRPNLSKNPRPAATARLRFEVGGKVVFAREVHQPARAANPFLANAFPGAVQGLAPDIMEAFRRVLFP